MICSSLPCRLKQNGPTPLIGIRMNPDVYHRAKVAAVMDKKLVGKWVKEAIREKLDRRKKGQDDD